MCFALVERTFKICGYLSLTIKRVPGLAEVSLWFVDNQYVRPRVMLAESSRIELLYLVPYNGEFFTVVLTLIQNNLVNKISSYYSVKMCCKGVYSILISTE
jgi:hypothetical protein